MTNYAPGLYYTTYDNRLYVDEVEVLGPYAPQQNCG
jgi:hypothetical protein